MFRHQLPHHQFIRKTNGCTNCRCCGQIDDDGCLGSEIICYQYALFTSIKEKKPRKLTSSADHHYSPWLAVLNFTIVDWSLWKQNSKIPDSLWIFPLPALKKIKAQIVIAIVITCLDLEGVGVQTLLLIPPWFL